MLGQAHDRLWVRYSQLVIKFDSEERTINKEKFQARTPLEREAKAKGNKY